MEHTAQAESEARPAHAPEAATESGVTTGGKATAGAIREGGYAAGLRNRQVQMIAFGGAIGTGLFLGAGERLNVAGPSLVIIFAITGLFAFFITRAMGELVMHRPTSGSFVSYSREFLGEKAAYTTGWVYFLHWICSGIAEITAVAMYLQYWAAFRDIPQWTLALVALLVVLGANLISVRWFGEFEFWFSIIKVAAILAFLAIGCWLLASRHPVDGHSTGPQLIADNGGMLPNGLLPAIVLIQGVVFAYAAIEMVGIASGETENPRKVIPRAINSVSWRIVLFYVGSVLLLVLLLPWSAYKAGESPFVTLLGKLGVPGISGIMNFVILTAALSSCNSGLYSTGRVLRSMGLAGSAPGFTTKMSKKGVPYGGVLLTATCYIAGIILNYIVPERAFSIVINFSAITMIGTWVMIMICQMVLRRKSLRGELERPSFRLPGAPYTSWLTIVFLVAVVVLMVVGGGDSAMSVYCSPLIVAGLVIGWFLTRKRVAEHAAAASASASASVPAPASASDSAS
ncbi:amino acid permease [Streptomyces sp. NBC_01016]|uniref:amino acid permease n=1 Tax=Streptomyces sp. NBC_01016 TaxID=2903720 RepID=UPI00225150C5|nr:amino acid permease [Streptomyces sp. NBC_01016]MCX4827610.1 amino acid permease [Streptomyces sp. NBC_01016]